MEPLAPHKYPQEQEMIVSQECNTREAKRTAEHQARRLAVVIGSFLVLLGVCIFYSLFWLGYAPVWDKWWILPTFFLLILLCILAFAAGIILLGIGIDD